MSIIFTSGHTITVRELDLGLNGIYRPVLRRVKKSGETNMILDCSIEKLPEVLIQAQQVNLFIVLAKIMRMIIIMIFIYLGRINV